MADLTLAIGDLNPPLMVTLLNRNVFPPAPVDLTLATGVDIMWRSVDSGAQVTRAAAIVAPRIDGRVSYQWVGADTAAPGRRWVAFVVHGPGGDATYAGFEVLVADPIPAVTAIRIAAVRTIIGHATPPSDDDIARALAEHHSVNASAIAFLRLRLADMLASPLQRTTDAGTFNYTENAKLLQAMIVRLEDLADPGDDGGGGVDDPGSNRLRVHSLTRADHYRDAAFSTNRDSSGYRRLR